MDSDCRDLIRFVDQWQSRDVMVVGDFMLDRYVYGDADRLSPDAPVPVLAARRREARPGGAGGVCQNLRALRCGVRCVGVVGADDQADHLKQALTHSGCDASDLLTCPDRPTTVKHNFIGLAQHRHPQKMFRVDDESRHPIPEKIQRRLLTKVRAGLSKTGVLCIEDYNKGVVTAQLCGQLIELAGRHGVPVIVDPAAIEDYRKYRHATCITPNRTEATLATASDPPRRVAAAPASASRNGRRSLKTPGAVEPHVDPQVEAMARALVRRLGLQAAVLTLDKQGALLLEKGKRPRLVPTVARSVYDVTGAGDVVLAMLAAARANGADWLTAVRLANVAAGLEVEKFGAVPIELDEVLLALLQQHHQRLGKQRTVDQLLPELDAYRKQKRTIALTNGCFDILHAGHVAMLRAARQTADLLVLAVNSDASIRRLKGPQRPIVPLEDRLEVLGELECVDYIVVFGDDPTDKKDRDTPLPLLRAIKPDVLVKGGTYKLSEVVGGDAVRAYGGRVVTIPPIKGRSTTNIVERIKAQAKT